MAKDHQTGKLAVILHADVAGSTQMVQQDEHLTHDQIQDAFRRFSDVINKYSGRVLELRGDALLDEFDRPSDAIVATLAFQAGHSTFLSTLTDDLKPEIRVGITMGEVVIADNTVTGAGVVLAQRVEQLADTGGLCITSAIHEGLPRRLPINFENIGEQALKGFDDPVHVYRVKLRPGEVVPPPEQSNQENFTSGRKKIAVIGVIALVVSISLLAWLTPWGSINEKGVADSALSGSAIPSIAVLPFDNMSDDPNQEYLSDGITEDIITDLSQLKNLAVIARNSSFTYRNTSAKVQEIGEDLGNKYILEDSVRKAGNQIRITAQLIDTDNGHHLWAGRFDRELTEIFALQDEITEKIVTALSIQLNGDEQQQLSRNTTNSFEAYDLFLQGQMLGARFTKEGFEQAAETYRNAIKLDPRFARAYGALAVTLTRQVTTGYSDSPAEMQERALEMVQKATAVNPYSPQAKWALGYVYMYRKQFDKAVEALERAVSLSPSYADGYAMLALIKNNLGHAEEAIRLIEKGIKLNPYYSWDYLYNLGRAYYALGDYQKATQYLQQALERNEAPRAPRLFLIASLVQLSQLEDAEWEIMQLEVSNPEVTLSHLQAVLVIADTELWNRLKDDLRAAGMSE